MAFASIIDDTRRMNAKMIAMGQSIDIQKMPRPKQGTQMAQKQAMYTPSGSEVEKMLYPKNFKPRAYEAEEEKAPAAKAQEEKAAIAIMEEVIEEQKTEPQIIGDTEEEPQEKEMPQAATTKPFPKNSWESCKHYKAQGERAFCKEYLGWCAKGKCTRPKY